MGEYTKDGHLHRLYISNYVLNVQLLISITTYTIGLNQNRFKPPCLPQPNPRGIQNGQSWMPRRSEPARQLLSLMSLVHSPHDSIITMALLCETYLANSKPLLISPQWAPASCKLHHGFGIELPHHISINIHFNHTYHQ